MLLCSHLFVFKFDCPDFCKRHDHYCLSELFCLGMSRVGVLNLQEYSPLISDRAVLI